MRLSVIIISGFVAGLIIAVAVLWYQGQGTSATGPETGESSQVVQAPGTALSKYPPSTPVAVDSANTRVDELYQLLNQARQRSTSSATPPVPFVLHGEEIRYFTRQQFQQHRELVELAAELDANMVVEVKICRTTMQVLGIEDADLPGFVELVPFGPDEVERLGSEGYEVYTTF